MRSLLLAATACLSLTTSALADASTTPLMWAAQEGNLKKAQELVAQGADVNARNSNGMSVLYHTIFHKHADVARFLQSRGAKAANENERKDIQAMLEGGSKPEVMAVAPTSAAPAPAAVTAPVVAAKAVKPAAPDDEAVIKQTTELLARPGVQDIVRLEAFGTRGSIRQKRGDMKGARADFDAAIAEVPGAAYGYVVRGGLFLATGQLDKAIEDSETALSLTPNHIGALQTRARARAKKGQYELAVADYDAAFTLWPVADIKAERDAAARKHLQAGGATDAQITEALAQEEAEKARLKSEAGASAAAAAGARAGVARGKELYRSGELDAALSEFNQALRLDSNLADAYIGKGVVEYAQKKFASAEESFSRALRAEPGSDRARAGLAEAQAAKAQAREADNAAYARRTGGANKPYVNQSAKTLEETLKRQRAENCSAADAGRDRAGCIRPR